MVVPSPSLSAREAEAERSLSLIQLQASSRWGYMVKPISERMGEEPKGLCWSGLFCCFVCLFGQHDTS